MGKIWKKWTGPFKVIAVTAEGLSVTVEGNRKRRVIPISDVMRTDGWPTRAPEGQIAVAVGEDPPRDDESEGLEGRVCEDCGEVL